MAQSAMIMVDEMNKSPNGATSELEETSGEDDR
jgi:hypothetical protein